MVITPGQRHRWEPLDIQVALQFLSEGVRRTEGDVVLSERNFRVRDFAEALQLGSRGVGEGDVAISRTTKFLRHLTTLPGWEVQTLNTPVGSGPGRSTLLRHVETPAATELPVTESGTEVSNADKVIDVTTAQAPVLREVDGRRALVIFLSPLMLVEETKEESTPTSMEPTLIAAPSGRMTPTDALHAIMRENGVDNLMPRTDSGGVFRALGWLSGRVFSSSGASTAEEQVARVREYLGDWLPELLWMSRNGLVVRRDGGWWNRRSSAILTASLLVLRRERSMEHPNPKVVEFARAAVDMRTPRAARGAQYDGVQYFDWVWDKSYRNIPRNEHQEVFEQIIGYYLRGMDMWLAGRMAIPGQLRPVNAVEHRKFVLGVE